MKDKMLYLSRKDVTDTGLSMVKENNIGTWLPL